MASSKPPANDRPVRPLATAVSANVQQRIGEVFGLWDELSDFGKDETDAALGHCLERICRLLDAQDSFWVGIVHVLKDAPRRQKADILSGWRIRSIRPLHPHYHDTRHNKKLVKTVQPVSDPGATNIALAATTGRFRAFTLQSSCLVDMDAFERTDHYDFYYRQRDTRDRIWVASPVSADTESVFCFDRIGDTSHFDETHLELAAFALRGIKWFHRQLMLSHGLGLCDEPLTPAEHRVIRGLLSRASEREIAESMKLSQGTVHQYATRIYQKYAVHGRLEFTALWLSGNPGAQAAHPAVAPSGTKA